MHFLGQISGTPKKVPIDFVQAIKNFRRKHTTLHYIGGMAEITACDKITLSAIDNMFTFHPCNFGWTLSITKLKSWEDASWCLKGKPGYLPRLGVDLIPSTLHTSLQCSELIFRKKNTLDFKRLTFYPQ